MYSVRQGLEQNSCLSLSWVLQMGQFSRSALAGSCCIGSLRFVMVLFYWGFVVLSTFCVMFFWVLCVWVG